MRDEERVAAFMKAWGLEADGIRDDLLALLADVRGAEHNDVIAGSVVPFGNIETRVRTLIAELSPVHSAAAPGLIAQVRKEVVEIIVDELTKAGMTGDSAKVFAGFLSMAFKLTPKVKA